VPIPERLVPALKARPDGRPPGAAAITSPRGSRLALENWKRPVNWQAAIVKVGREGLRVHDLRHTVASLSRRAGADLRLLQKAMGHASIAVTAHTYADLFDDELDNIAAALDSLSDDLNQSTLAAAAARLALGWPNIGPIIESESVMTGS
jgi:integrase